MGGVPDETMKEYAEKAKAAALADEGGLIPLEAIPTEAEENAVPTAAELELAKEAVLPVTLVAVPAVEEVVLPHYNS